MFYVTRSSINYLAILESPISKHENKTNALNTVTHALTENLSLDFRLNSCVFGALVPASLTMHGEGGGGGKTHIKNTPEENLMVKPLLILNQIAELPFLFYLCVQTHPAYNQNHRIPSRALTILSSRRKMFKVEACFVHLTILEHKDICLRGKAWTSGCFLLGQYTNSIDHQLVA